ncbi:MAG: hypothetical protein V4696_03895 [Pseudomonadota bacterium]
MRRPADKPGFGRRRWLSERERRAKATARHWAIGLGILAAVLGAAALGAMQWGDARASGLAVILGGAAFASLFIAALAATES